MFRSFVLSALLLSAAPALAQSPPSTPAPSADADALCFVAAAITVRRLERAGEPANQTERDRRHLLNGIANFHGGRVSSRYTLEELPRVLEAAVAAATRLDLARHAGECSPRFLAFMRVVAGNN